MPTKTANQALVAAPVPTIAQDGEDYIANLLPEQSLWLAVGPASLLIKRTYEGVIVDFFARGAEDTDSVGGAYVFDSDLAAVLDDATGEPA